MYFLKDKAYIQKRSYLDVLFGKFEHIQLPNECTIEFSINNVHFIVIVCCSIDTVSLSIGQNPVKIEFNSTNNSGELYLEKCDPNALLRMVMAIIAIM